MGIRFRFSIALVSAVLFVVLVFGIYVHSSTTELLIKNSEDKLRHIARVEKVFFDISVNEFSRVAKLFASNRRLSEKLGILETGETAEQSVREMVFSVLWSHDFVDPFVDAVAVADIKGQIVASTILDDKRESIFQMGDAAPHRGTVFVDFDISAAYEEPVLRFLVPIVSGDDDYEHVVGYFELYKTTRQIEERIRDGSDAWSTDQSILARAAEDGTFDLIFPLIGKDGRKVTNIDHDSHLYPLLFAAFNGEKVFTENSVDFNGISVLAAVVPMQFNNLVLLTMVEESEALKAVAILDDIFAILALAVTSRQVVWLFFKQLWFEFVPVLHGLQGRFTAQG